MPYRFDLLVGASLSGRFLPRDITGQMIAVFRLARIFVHPFKVSAEVDGSLIAGLHSLLSVLTNLSCLLVALGPNAAPIDSPIVPSHGRFFRALTAEQNFPSALRAASVN